MLYTLYLHNITYQLYLNKAYKRHKECVIQGQWEKPESDRFLERDALKGKMRHIDKRHQEYLAVTPDLEMDLVGNLRKSRPQSFLWASLCLRRGAEMTRVGLGNFFSFFFFFFSERIQSLKDTRACWAAQVLVSLPRACYKNKSRTYFF